MQINSVIINVTNFAFGADENDDSAETYYYSSS